MNFRLILILIVAVFLNGGCSRTATAPVPPQSASQSSATPDELASTRASSAKHCQSCHGEQGNGGPVKLEDGTRLKVPSLREGHALRHPDSDFIKQITKGGDGMPAFADKLKPEEINDLVRFVRHEFQPGVTPPAEKSPMKGMKM